MPTYKYGDEALVALCAQEGLVYGSDVCESYDHATLDEAIEDALDCATTFGDALATSTFVVARRIDARGYHDASEMASALVESWDEEHGDPNKGPTAIWPELLEACGAVCAVFAAELPVSHWCQEIAYVEVDGLAWVTTHRPDWLSDAADD